VLDYLSGQYGQPLSKIISHLSSAVRRQIEVKVPDCLPSPPNTGPELFILDDMGLKKLPLHAGEHLFEIIMRRYELRSTIMTSNRPLDEWGKLVGDVPTATAILDRFLDRAEVIQITGKSYRLKGKACEPREGRARERKSNAHRGRF